VLAALVFRVFSVIPGTDPESRYYLTGMKGIKGIKQKA